MRLGIKIIDLIRRTDILGKYNNLKYQAKSGAPNYPDNQLITQLLINLKTHNKYYKALLQEYSNEEIAKDSIWVLNQLPLIDKTTINANYNSIFTPIKGRKTQKKKTGGSTGAPFYYHVDADHLSWFWAYIYFFWHRFADYEPGDPFITIAGNSLRTSKTKIVEGTYHKLQNNYFIKGDIIDEKLTIDYHQTNKAVLLYGYPSSILNIIRIKPELIENLNNLRAIFTTSEQLIPQTRKEIEETFKCPVYDMYGANDGGILTCECELHNGYHINTLNCFVQTFVNDHGLNEILLTNLNSYSFPFVRYRVGDIGTITFQPCECGLPGPRIVSLKGRTRDLIKLADGKTIHGSFFNKAFFKHSIIDGYKIVQEKDLSITLHIHVKDEAMFEDIASSVKLEIENALSNINISVLKMKELNPTNDKFKLIESHAI